MVDILLFKPYDIWDNIFNNWIEVILMVQDFVRDLSLNASFLLVICIAFLNMYIRYRKRKRLFNNVMGFFVGIVGIILLINTVTLKPGYIFDTRSILICVSGMFFGFFPTLIGSIIICAYRVYIGGSGVYMGILVTFLSGVTGLLWRRLRWDEIEKQKNNRLEFYIFGLVTHVFMLACVAVLPKNSLMEVLSAISLPVLTIFPLITMILCIVIYDGLQKNKMKECLEEREALLVCLFNSIPDMIFFKDKNSRYLGCNRAFEKYTGFKEADIIGKSVFELYDKKKAERYRQSDIIAIQGNVIHEIDEQFASYDGSIVDFDTIKTPYYDTAGEILGMVGISRDISERNRKEKEIAYLSLYDILTGLYNRGFFESEKKRLNTAEFMPLSIIIGDINGLKLVNDAFGHDVGDKLLAATAKALKSCVRENDVIARIGGDEYCVLMPNTDESAALTVMENMKEACSHHSALIDSGLSYTNVSLGYATKFSADEKFENVMRIAEEHMYRRKLLVQKSLHSTIISSIKAALAEKSIETEEHCERMAVLSGYLGSELHLSGEDIDALVLLSELHDIGKISIEKSILTKTQALTPEEWSEIQKHPGSGYRIALSVPTLSQIAQYILSHHERWDGKGYPQGLQGEDIPLLSRIISVVDSFDAMTNDRAYRKAMSIDEAAAIIMSEAGKQFDPKIAKIFVEKVIHDWNKLAMV